MGGRWHPELQDGEWLREQYVDRARSTGHIALEVGCTNGAVGHALRRHGIPVRARGKHVRHGHATKTAGKSPTYQTWRGMVARCTDPSNVVWSYYGGRGITVCARWSTFDNFLADMGERPEGRTLDRIDGNGNYEPANCRWATPKEQRANQRPPSTRISSETGQAAS